MTPRRPFLLLLLGALLACGAGAQLALAGESAFASGNRLYENGRYAEAAAAYQAAIRSGAASANLFYNLGNACFRAGEPGRAVLNYERALRLQPAHPEAAANLAFARRQLGLPASTKDPAVSGFITRRAAALGPWLLAAGCWLLLAWLAARRGGDKPRGFLAPAAVGVALLSLVAGAVATFWLTDPRLNDPARAVIVGKDGVEARYAPADTAGVAAALPTGGELRVLQERGAWDYVELAGGTRAWVAAAQVERIAPVF